MTVMRLPDSFALTVPAFAMLMAGTALAQQGPSPAPASKTVPVFENGQAQIVPGFQDPTQWIRQSLWVQTEFDSDGDGKPDRVFVDVTRPRQTDTEGLKVAVIYESSPYYAGIAGGKNYFWNTQQELGAQSPTRSAAPSIQFQSNRRSVANSLVKDWVPRGFAVVHSEAPGTGLSQGCPTMGGPPEALAPKAVIDWLNGRARGYTTADGNDTVSATSWSTGKVGMTGTSYNGTLTVAAATTGVDGLEAIIPVAPLISYYWYYRSNGMVRSPGGYLGEDIDVLYDAINSGDPKHRDYCAKTYRDGEIAAGLDRASGDQNDFWKNRSYFNNVGKIKAATLMSHGFNDWNVMTEHSVRVYEALKQRKVPVQAYYHQGGHGGDPPMEQMNRWFSRYLYGIKNDVESEPRARIVREGASAANPTSYADYPNPAAAPATLYLQSGGRAVGGLQFSAGKGQKPETLTDDVAQSATVLAQAAESPNRLLYATAELTEPLHLSGWSKISVRLASNKPTANLSVYLVALPFGKGSVITRGWMDPQNHASLNKGEPLVPGKFYDLKFDLQPDDQIIPAGSRLALMIFSSDRDFTLWPPAGTELTVDLNATSITLPVVGGAKALKQAFSKDKK